MKREIQGVASHNAAFRTIIVAILTVIGLLGTSFANSAFAAEVMTLNQSNAVIDLADQSKSTNDITLNVNAQPGDVVTVTLDHRLWSSKTWPNAAAFATYGTVKTDEANNTATFTFDAITEPSSWSLTVALAPTIDNSQTLTPRTDTDILTAGDYSLKATIAHTDSTNETKSVDFSIKNAYTAGDSWDEVVFKGRNANDTYLQGTAYTFTLDDSLRVTYPENSGTKLAWNPSITQFKLSMPADFALDTTKSPGWSQDGTVLSFDPTQVGAQPAFTGTFGADPQDDAYTTSDASSVTGYFGTPSEKKTLGLTQPVKIRIVKEGATADGSSSQPTPSEDTPTVWVFYDGTGAKSVYLPSESVKNRADIMTSTYSLGYSTQIPAEALKDVDFAFTSPDGSRITGGNFEVTNPVAGQKYTFDLQFPDGTQQSFTHEVTAAEATGFLRITLPDARDSPWVKVNFSTPDAMPKDTKLKWNLNFAAQNSYEEDASNPSKNLEIQNKDVRYPSVRASGTGVKSGKDTFNGYNIPNGATPQNPVTYYTDLRNSDVGMAIGTSSSNVDSTLPADISYFDSEEFAQTALLNSGSQGAAETTAYTIYEPVFYVMIPKKATIVGTPAVDSSIPQPEISISQTATGQSVVKFDWSGTGWMYNPRTDSAMSPGKFSVKWKAADEYGITSSSAAAVWLSTVNDPDVAISASSVNGNAASVSVDGALAKEATGGDKFAKLVGSMTVVIRKVNSGPGISQSISIIDNTDSEPGKSAINVLTSKKNADHKIRFFIANYQSTSDTAVIRQLVNLPSDVDIRLSGPIILNKTDGTTAEVAPDATILYSTSTQTPPAGNDPTQVSESGYVTADEVSDWSAIRSFVVDIPESASDTEYYATADVTDEQAAEQDRQWTSIKSAFYAQGWASRTTELFDSYVSMQGEKTWNDGNNIDRLRPDSVTLRLLAADGTEADSATASADSDWKYDFEKATASVPAQDATHTDADFTKYTLSEDAVTGYTAKVSGLDVENTHQPATVDVAGSVVWDDANNQDGKQPESVTVKLLANGKEVDSAKVSAGADGKWAFAFSNVPEFKDGEKITYTVEESDVPEGYTVAVNGYVLTNTHTPKVTPTEPVEPTEPTDPVEPVNPTEPVEPSTPAEPSTPVEPSGPATKPAEPTVPAPQVVTAPKAVSSLAHTGSNVAVIALVALLLVLPGVGLMVMRRRKA